MKIFLKLSLLLFVFLAIFFSLNCNDELSMQQMENIKGGAGFYKCYGETPCGPASDTCDIIRPPTGDPYCTNGVEQGSIKACASGIYQNCAHIGPNEVHCYGIQECEYDDSVGGTGVCRLINTIPQNALDCKVW